MNSHHYSTISDYFGDAKNDKQMGIILGIYQKMIISKGVSAELLDNCMKTNRLNELVHAKYKYEPTVYYKLFCSEDINLDCWPCLQTVHKSDYMKIFDDNHCPGCLKAGYITDNNRNGHIDCEKCLKLMCKYCIGNDTLCKNCEI
jgi:hypothetical protein